MLPVSARAAEHRHPSPEQPPSDGVSLPEKPPSTTTKGPETAREEPPKGAAAKEKGSNLLKPLANKLLLN